MRFAEFKLIEASNPEVAQAQEILKDLGYDLGPTGVDGVLGPYTQAAIDKYTAGDAPNAGVGINPNKSSGPGIKPSSGGIGFKAGGKPINAPIGQGFKGAQHPGVDIPVPIGTPVRCPEDGVVEIATFHEKAGNYVNVKTASGKQRFLHLSKMHVTAGDRVSAGDIIGLSGNTGLSTGPHLHWEKYAGNQMIDPVA
jgi:murein DD-endopeptidase MepM/ murein hydrolase activator NlpD